MGFLPSESNRELFIYHTSQLGHIIRYRDSDIDDILHRIVIAVANEKGVEEIELSPLYGVVDTDALQALISNTVAPVEVTFDWEGLAIRVGSDGVAVVDRND